MCTTSLLYLSKSQPNRKENTLSGRFKALLDTDMILKDSVVSRDWCATVFNTVQYIIKIRKMKSEITLNYLQRLKLALHSMLWRQLIAYSGLMLHPGFQVDIQNIFIQLMPMHWTISRLVHSWVKCNIQVRIGAEGNNWKPFTELWIH